MHMYSYQSSASLNNNNKILLVAKLKTLISARFLGSEVQKHYEMPLNVMHLILS